MRWRGNVGRRTTHSENKMLRSNLGQKEKNCNGGLAAYMMIEAEALSLCLMLDDASEPRPGRLGIDASRRRISKQQQYTSLTS